MLKLGKKQTLVMIKEVEFGVYLAEKMDSEEKVLLPKKQVPKDLELSDSIEVFLYKDSSDRMIATVNEPYIQIGKPAVLKVKEVSKKQKKQRRKRQRCPTQLKSRTGRKRVR